MRNMGTKTMDSEIAALKKYIHTLSSELQLLTEKYTDKNVFRTLKNAYKLLFQLPKY